MEIAPVGGCFLYKFHNFLHRAPIKIQVNELILAVEWNKRKKLPYRASLFWNLKTIFFVPTACAETKKYPLKAGKLRKMREFYATSF